MEQESNMSGDLIGRKALIEFARNHKDCMVDANDIARFPAVDAVEVVRCKQCIFRFYSDSSNSYYCKKWDVDDYEEAFVEEYDFCSKGKKEIDNG
jgi:hypothetical protein